MSSHLWDRYHFDFFVSLKEMLTFSSLPNLVLQFSSTIKTATNPLLSFSFSLWCCLPTDKHLQLIHSCLLLSCHNSHTWHFYLRNAATRPWQISKPTRLLTPLDTGGMSHVTHDCHVSLLLYQFTGAVEVLIIYCLSEGRMGAAVADVNPTSYGQHRSFNGWGIDVYGAVFSIDDSCNTACLPEWRDLPFIICMQQSSNSL